MTTEERIEMSKVVITDKTFKKTEQEKIDLFNAKRKHKQMVRDTPNYMGGVR